MTMTPPLSCFTLRQVGHRWPPFGLFEPFGFRFTFPPSQVCSQNLANWIFIPQIGFLFRHHWCSPAQLFGAFRLPMSSQLVGAFRLPMGSRA
jgi:hypothetical protein